MEDWLTVENKITVGAIDTAFDRLEDFTAVNKARNMEDKKEALDIMIGSFGLDQDNLLHIRKRLERLSPPKHDIGTALIGVLAGLFIAEEKTE